MKTLIVYDNNGKIFTQLSGDYVKPEGLQSLEIVIPENKVLKGVDVKNKEPIFEDKPKSQMDNLQELIKNQEEALIELAIMISEVMS